MRKPSEYLPAALAGLRSRLLPDCSETLVHGGNCALVTRIDSPKRGEDAASDVGPLEECRVLASASDFPGLRKGSTVTYKETPRFVVSAKTEPAQATLLIGLTPPLEPVVWTQDAEPHARATFLVALRRRGPSQSAGHVYDYVTGDEWKAFVCDGGTGMAAVKEGDTFQRMSGEVLTIQQIHHDEIMGWTFTLTSNMKGPLQ